jgi:predicted PurR-regulated permease PerM
MEHVFLLALLLAGAVACLTLALDWFLLRHEGWRPMAMATISDLILSLIAFVLLVLLLVRARQRRRQVVHQLEVIDQMNHHIRNALQVISFNARPVTRNDWELAEIKQAVERIHWTLREILPRLEPQYLPYEYSKPQPEQSEPSTVEAQGQGEKES